MIFVMKTLTLKPFLNLPLDQQLEVKKRVVDACHKFYLDGNSVDVCRRKTELHEKVSRQVVDRCLHGTPLFLHFCDRNRLSNRIRHASIGTIHLVGLNESLS